MRVFLETYVSPRAVAAVGSRGGMWPGARLAASRCPSLSSPGARFVAQGAGMAFGLFPPETEQSGGAFLEGKKGRLWGGRCSQGEQDPRACTLSGRGVSSQKGSFLHCLSPSPRPLSAAPCPSTWAFASQACTFLGRRSVPSDSKANLTRTKESARADPKTCRSHLTHGA